MSESLLSATEEVAESLGFRMQMLVLLCPRRVTLGETLSSLGRGREKCCLLYL